MAYLNKRDHPSEVHPELGARPLELAQLLWTRLAELAAGSREY